MTKITMKISGSAFHLMASESVESVLSRIAISHIFSVTEILTFGMVNTPITHNATGALCAYVVYWQNRLVTVCKVDGNEATVIGLFNAERSPDVDEALTIFHKHWVQP